MAASNGTPAGKSNGSSDGGNNDKDAKPRQSTLTRIKQLWLAKTGIDQRTYMQMFKGALAPLIAIAAYQATPYADQFTTVGYLVGIAAILSVPIQPRAKFLQTMLVNVFAVCLGAAIALLAMYCSVQARIHSTGSARPGTGGAGTSGLAAGGAATARYNSSGSAVAGVWLFTWIWAISVLRAKYPQFTIPCILCAIFANVSMIYCPQFSTMVQAMAFAKKLLIAFLSGFGISTGVSLFIFPFSSRQVSFKEMTGYIASLRAAVKANLDYLHSIEDADMFAPHRINTAGDDVAGNKEADEFKVKVAGLGALHAKVNADLPFAKRETALGKLGPDDLQQIFKHLRQVMIPTIGLSSTSDVFARIAEQRGWDRTKDYSHIAMDGLTNEEEKIRAESVQEWQELVRRLREPFGRISQAIDEGLEHAAIVLQLAPKRKKSDAEATGGESQPGDAGFAAFYHRRTLDFLDSKKDTLRGWASLHGIDLPPDFFDEPNKKDFTLPAWMQQDNLSPARQRLRRQLFLCLYMEFLLFRISKGVYDLVLYADGLVASGKLSKTRLVVPGWKRMRKWMMSTCTQGGESHDDQQIDSESKGVTIYLGEAYKQRRDPEHLPPANAWERSSNVLRKFSHLLGSPESAFGFRVACATMSIAVVAYLQDTQVFYTKERLFWAQIMISISMSPSAGQSLRSFWLRIFGTFVAMVLSYVAYYIVDGRTAGVLVFFFIFLHAGVWIILKYPQFTPVGMITQVTLTLILGYELQVRKVGIAVAISNGQAYFPIYELAPIRLATVCGGLLLAEIWTVFPFPISEHSQLRQNLGRALYLMANYYSVMHETVRVRLRGGEDELTSRDSPGHKLEKARMQVFGKCTAILSGLRAQAGFVKFDIPVGGRFPREQYQQIIALMQSTMNFMMLISIASASFSELQEHEQRDDGSEWLKNFRVIIGEANMTSEQVTTLLSLLSHSVSTGSPLPPYLRVPEPYALSKRLDELDQDILNVRHIAQPGYAAFAVIQIGTRCLVEDLQKILKGVKELVGELDFSYHVVSTTDSSRNDSEETLTYPKIDRAETDAQRKQD